MKASFPWPLWLGAVLLATGLPRVDLRAQSSPPPLPPPPPRPVIPVRPVIPGTAMMPQPPANPNALVFDAETKDTAAQPGQANVNFTFHLTNVSSSTVIINSVRTSCGCTTAKLPPMPWQLPAGTNAAFEVSMNISGKVGTVPKTVTVDSTAGIKVLTVRAVIPATPLPVAGAAGATNHGAAMNEVERVRNQQMALADRQAVFKGDCASCHVRPGEGKMGKDLFAAVCGVCHEAEHRATMVPDLRNLDHATDAEHWRAWASYGRVGSLMPAFAKSQGGSLTDEQIGSLVEYLVKTVPSHPRPGLAPKPAPAASIPPQAAAVTLPPKRDFSVAQ